MEMISDRVGIVKGEDDLTVYIKASTPKDIRRLNLFKTWVILWTLSGLVIFSQLFLDLYTREEKLYIVIYLAFWGYFEYRTVRAYYFRKYGIETIYINNDKFMVRRDILSKQGKPKYYQVHQRNPFREVEDKSGSMNRSYYNSFWVVTGGNIAFSHAEGEHRVGLQLQQEEVRKIVKLMNSYIRVQSTPKE